MNRSGSSLWGKWFVTCVAITLSQGTVADIDFNGFATMAGGMTLSSDESLQDYDSDPSFEQNSFAGLQANADLGDGLSAVAQVVSRGSESWNTKFEWAYIGYEVNDNFKILAGKQRLPYYLYSDYLDVSYAYHWITPPEGAYSVPFNSATGISLFFTNQIGDIDSRLHFLAGRNTAQFTSNGETVDFESSNMYALAWTLEYNSLTFRLGYSQGDLVLDVPALNQIADAWTQTSAGFSQIPNDPYNAASWASFGNAILGTNGDDSGDFGGVGLTYDNGDILAVAEYTTLGTEGSINLEETSGYYFSFGKHFGNLLPHITYGSTETTPTDPAFLDDVPLGLDAGLDTLVATTEGLFAASAEKNTYYIVGLRWDFHPSAAFKVDFKSQKDEIPINQTNNLVRFALVTVF